MSKRYGNRMQVHGCALRVLIWYSLWLLFSMLQTVRAETLAGPDAAQRLAFLAALEGPWEGQARRTPIGPRPYDITFVRTAQSRVEGEAHPGASVHYWTFYEEEAALKLRFLSTFAGNQQPLRLLATAERQGTMVFQASPSNFLEVHVQPHTDTLTIQIFLRGKPHVDIYLSRHS